MRRVINPKDDLISLHEETSDNRPRRSRKLTTKGLVYQIQQLIFLQRTLENRLDRMVKETNEMMTSPFNKNAVLEKLDQVSTTFESFLSTHKELVELVKNTDHLMDAAEEEKYFVRIDQQIFQLKHVAHNWLCLLYTSPSPRDGLLSRMPSSA